MKTLRNHRQSAATWNIHPGEILREEFLKPLHMSSYELAKNLHVPAPRINDIVLEKRGITADTAIRLARFFATTEDFWMNLQASFEIHDARRRLAKVIERIQPRRRTQAA
jgi:antitoxin HigA-1